MPDLAFSGAGNIVDAWTVQQLVNNSTQNLGYDTKAPEEEPEEAEDEKKEETDGK